MTMLSYDFFLDLAIILLSTKIFGLLTRKVQMPQVVGALLAGVLLGPTFLNVLQETEFIDKMAELGVIMLMFTAGMETDIKELKQTGKASFIIAAFGVGIPLIGGFLAAAVFSGNIASMSKLELLQIFYRGHLNGHISEYNRRDTSGNGKAKNKVRNSDIGSSCY